MANKAVFSGAATPGRAVPETDIVNEAGGSAYSLDARAALAQLAVTGTFNETYYGGPVDQLNGIRKAADLVTPTFLAKCAIYARRKGGMKDMPAALLVMLSKADPALLSRIFDTVIDNGKMLRNFVQMVRSGVFHRKSLGSGPKRLIGQWIRARSAPALLRASVGKNPALADVIRLAHVRSRDPEQKALIGYLVGKPHDADALPDIVKQFEAFKTGETNIVPDVDFRLLTSLPLTREHWEQIARNGRHQFVRMNLNTFARHGVFDNPDAVTQLGQTVGGPDIIDVIVSKLADRDEVIRGRQFPYQYLTAYINSGPCPEKYGCGYGPLEKPEPKDYVVPMRIRNALQDALEIATENVPVFGKKVAVIVDTSGSMLNPVTGDRGKGATTLVRCIDVAALVAATLMRRDENVTVLPCDTKVHVPHGLNPRDTIITNATKLANMGWGGTSLSIGLTHLNRQRSKTDLVIIVSDNQSWADPTGHGQGTRLMHEFRTLQHRNPGAKLVCINITPNAHTQAPDSSGEVLNIGGFSDAIWTAIARFSEGIVDNSDASVWVEEIEAIELPSTATGV